MISKRLFVLYLAASSLATFAQSSKSHLLFLYFGINENQSELNYISDYLEKNNLTMPGPDQEHAIIDAHNYYVTHQEEIDISTKANELIQFRSAVKSVKAAAWAQALGSIASSIPTAIAAGQQQQEEYQKKLNRDNEIQRYIAQHSSNAPKQYSQNFGSTPTVTNLTTRPQVTTSNGFDEPLSSASQSNTSSKHIGGTNNTSNDQIIQAVYVSGHQLVTCRLRYNYGRIWAYSTSKNPLGQEEWVSIQVPETPTPTMSIRDGDKAKDYKYTISGAGMIFYFNM